MLVLGKSQQFRIELVEPDLFRNRGALQALRDPRHGVHGRERLQGLHPPDPTARRPQVPIRVSEGELAEQSRQVLRQGHQLQSLLGHPGLDTNSIFPVSFL